MFVSVFVFFEVEAYLFMKLVVVLRILFLCVFACSSVCFRDLNELLLLALVDSDVLGKCWIIIGFLSAFGTFLL